LGKIVRKPRGGLTHTVQWHVNVVYFAIHISWIW